MKVTRTFDRCIFRPATIRKGLEAFLALPREDEPFEISTRTLDTESDRWSFDNDDEFFAAYDGGFVFASFGGRLLGDDEFEVDVTNQTTRIHTKVTAGRSSRGEIERVLSIFADAESTAYIPEPEPPPARPEPPPIIFIGHGRSPQWRDLKDHLHDQHGYEVEAYETGARGGHAIRDILERMMKRSAFAVLVMTAEDEQADGELRARQIVVHEVGLFQGRLGFDRAVVAIENGVEPFSNLQGIHQLRFDAGRIREVYGDVLATLRREFPQHR